MQQDNRNKTNGPSRGLVLMHLLIENLSSYSFVREEESTVRFIGSRISLFKRPTTF